MVSTSMQRIFFFLFIFFLFEYNEAWRFLRPLQQRYQLRLFESKEKNETNTAITNRINSIYLQQAKKLREEAEQLEAITSSTAATVAAVDELQQQQEEKDGGIEIITTSSSPTWTSFISDTPKRRHLEDRPDSYIDYKRINNQSISNEKESLNTTSSFNNGMFTNNTKKYVILVESGEKQRRQQLAEQMSTGKSNKKSKSSTATAAAATTTAAAVEEEEEVVKGIRFNSINGNDNITTFGGLIIDEKVLFDIKNPTFQHIPYEFERMIAINRTLLSDIPSFLRQQRALQAMPKENQSLELISAPKTIKKSKIQTFWERTFGSKDVVDMSYYDCFARYYDFDKEIIRETSFIFIIDTSTKMKVKELREQLHLFWSLNGVLELTINTIPGLNNDTNSFIQFTNIQDAKEYIYGTKRLKESDQRQEELKKILLKKRDDAIESIKQYNISLTSIYSFLLKRGMTTLIDEIPFIPLNEMENMLLATCVYIESAEYVLNYKGIRKDHIIDDLLNKNEIESRLLKRGEKLLKSYFFTSKEIIASEAIPAAAAATDGVMMADETAVAAADGVMMADETVAAAADGVMMADETVADAINMLENSDLSPSVAAREAVNNDEDDVQTVESFWDEINNITEQLKGMVKETENGTLITNISIKNQSSDDGNDDDADEDDDDNFTSTLEDVIEQLRNKNNSSTKKRKKQLISSVINKNNDFILSMIDNYEEENDIKTDADYLIRNYFDDNSRMFGLNVGREGAGRFQNEILRGILSVTGFRISSGAAIFEGTIINNNNHDNEKDITILDKIESKFNSSIFKDEVDYILIQNEKILDLDSSTSITELAMDQLLGSTPCIIVYPKMWNTTLSMIHSDPTRNFLLKIITFSTFPLTLYGVIKTTNLLELGLQASSLDTILPMALTSLLIQLIANLVEVTVAKKRNVKIDIKTIPAIQGVFNFGSRSNFLSIPKNKKDTFDIALSGIGTAIILSFITLYIGIGLTIDTPKDIINTYPMIPLSLLRTNSIIWEVFKPFVGDMSSSLDHMEEVFIHLHWLCIVGITSFIANIFQLLPLDNSAGSKIASASLEKDSFVVLSGAIALFKVIFLGVMIFDVGGFSSITIITKAKLLLDYILISQIVGNDTELQINKDNLSGLDFTRSNIFIAMTALLIISFFPYDSVTGQLSNSFNEILNYLQGLISDATIITGSTTTSMF